MASADTVNDSCQATTFSFKEHFSKPECNFNEFYPANYEFCDAPIYDQCFPSPFSYSEYDDYSWLYCMDTTYVTPYSDEAVDLSIATSPKKFEFSAEAEVFVLPVSRDDMLKLRPLKVELSTLTLPSVAERPPAVSARSSKKRSIITATSQGAVSQCSSGFSPSKAGGRDSDNDKPPTSPSSSSPHRSNAAQTPIRAKKGGTSDQ